MDSYDEIPYDSTPVTETDPDRLAVIGRLFGLEVADPSRSRVLELGCAAGGNLIPLAWRHPDSRYLGIELSARQVADGQGLVADLGLANIDIRWQDILGFGAGGEDPGEFDYILCHGVYSWVPEPVRDRILDICVQHLAPTGIAYISYNTLPGWRNQGALRDMLLYHTRGIEVPGERLARAQEFLDFIETATRRIDTDRLRSLRRQIERIRSAHPSYLYHEYLEAINEPFLFSDFVSRAEGKGLEYLADTELHTLFPSTLGDEVEAAIEPIEDAIRQEQYMDFVRDRGFRQTLLCRSGALGGRVLDLEQFERLAFFADLAPPAKLDLRRPKAQPFRRPDGESVSAEHPLTKAALQHLGLRYPDAVAFDELARVAADAVAAAGGTRHAAEPGHLFGELFTLFLHQRVGASMGPGSFSRAGVRPRASSLAVVQVKSGLAHVATPRHTTLSLDPLAARLLSLLDGSRDLDALVEDLVSAIGEEPALAQEWISKPLAGKELTARVRHSCERLLSLFARQGILASGDNGSRR